MDGVDDDDASHLVGALRDAGDVLDGPDCVGRQAHCGESTVARDNLIEAVEVQADAGSIDRKPAQVHALVGGDGPPGIDVGVVVDF